MNVEPIGRIHSCFKEKFGTPRQPGLVPSATAVLELLPPFNVPEALRGVEEFSHLWILFLLDRSLCEQFQPTVRPPRLGGNRRVGVFASRSNFRPNPIGLSVVELRGVRGTELDLAGGDFLDGTPVLDIKPYLPYADSLPTACAGFAATAPEPLFSVTFSPEAEESVRVLENRARPALRQLLVEMLRGDPRPAYQEEDPARLFGTRLFDLNVRWRCAGGCVTVEALEVSGPDRGLSG
jgi:tRNA-Thr(GGU) m(6)t(6)A37 methyltransferase TsaA